MASKFKFWSVAVVGMGLAAGGAWWLQAQPMSAKEITPASGKSAKGVTPPRVAGVEVAQVVAMPLRDDAQAVGSLRARQSVMLRPELVGRITALHFKDGGTVRKGQVLVQFDDLLQQADVQQMQAQLAIAQANYNRTQELVAANFMAKQTLDTSAAALQVAQAQLVLAQARLSRMAVRSPLDGTAGIRLVNVGDYVKDGTDLVALEDTRQMMVDFRLPERLGGKLRTGQNVEVVLDAVPGRTFNAVVEAIDPLLDANGRSIGVRAVLPQAAKASDKQPLRSGMFARVTTVFSVNDAALVVPEEAIVPQGNRQLVYKLVKPEPGAQLPSDTLWVSQRQEVTLGVRSQGKVEIVQGLRLGDTVVVAGQQRLQKDGTPVKVVQLGKPSSPKGASKKEASSAVAESPASTSSAENKASAH